MTRSFLDILICAIVLAVSIALVAPFFSADVPYCLAATPPASPEHSAPAVTESSGPGQVSETATPQPTPTGASAPLPASASPDIEEQVPPDYVIPEKQGGREVKVNGVVLFKLYAGTMTFPVERRVQFISERLSDIINNPESTPESFQAVYDESSGGCRIFYAKDFIFRIGTNDVPIQGVSTLAVGERYLDVIRDLQRKTAAKIWVEREKEGARIGVIGGGIFILALILGIIAIRWLSRRIEAMQGQRIKSIKIHDAVILSEERIASAITSTVSVLCAAIFIIAFAFFMDHLLARFPGTHEIRAALFANPLSYVKKAGYSMILYAPKLLFLIFFILLTRMLLGLCDTLFQAMKRGAIKIRSVYRPFVTIYHKITRALIYFFGLILIVPNLPGYDLPVFKGISLFAGLIISLGSSTFIGSVFAGLSILLSRTFKQGDRIKVGDYTGDVLEMSINSTRLRTPARQEIVIPNTYFLQNPVTNMSSPVEELGSTIIFSEITIGYDVHGDIVKDLCVKAGEATQGVLKEPKPFVWQKSLGDFYVTYSVGVYIDNPHAYLEISSALNQNIRKYFDEAGVEIMSPHYASLRDGNKVTIPGRYLPEDYRAPSFKVTTDGEEKK